MERCTCVGVEIGSHAASVEVPIPPHMWSYREARVRAGLSPTVTVDRCILPEIRRLWAQGVRTLGCCCGHGRQPGMINVNPEDMPAMIAMGYRADRSAPNPATVIWPRPVGSEIIGS